MDGYFVNQPLELVSSENKGIGWNAYLAGRNSIGIGPTSEIMKKMHTLTSSGLVLNLDDPGLRDQLTDDLYILDREDGDIKQNLFDNSLALNLRELGELHPVELFIKMRRHQREVCEFNTQVELDVQIAGQLRSYGRRKIGDGDWKTVYASHTTAYPDDESNLEIGQLGQIYPKSYFGLSTGLDLVYGALCNKYDELMAQRKDGSLEDKLLAEGFLQIVGTRVLHPFWDGNGRAFAAHIAYTLEREGIIIQDREILTRMQPGLTSITEAFLESLITNAGIGYIMGNGHFKMHFDNRFRQNYMRKLRAALDQLIVEGLEGSDDNYSMYSNAAWQIKRVLILNGLLNPKPGDETRLRMEEEMLREIQEEDRGSSIMFVPKVEEGRFK